MDFKEIKKQMIKYALSYPRTNFGSMINGHTGERFNAMCEAEGISRSSGIEMAVEHFVTEWEILMLKTEGKATEKIL